MLPSISTILATLKTRHNDLSATYYNIVTMTHHREGIIRYARARLECIRTKRPDRVADIPTQGRQIQHRLSRIL